MLQRAKRPSKTLPVGLRIGFLGGGQLARMMVLEAHCLGLEPHVFSQSPLDPAAQATAHWTHGSLQDSKVLGQFVNSMDYVTFESEFISSEALLQFEKTAPGKIFPKPSVMKCLQNRMTQKELLSKFKIPTSAFCSIQNTSDLEQAQSTLGARFVLKSTFGGYDGYGTFFVKNKADFAAVRQKISVSTVGFLAEKWVPFKRELAVILVRSRSGKCFSLPLVQTHQVQGRCDWVQGPVHHKAYLQLEKKLFKMLTEIDYVGAMGMEIFDVGTELLINELAPRVHNSGHYSQDALSESQFSLHIRAGLGCDLQVPTSLAAQFVMVNLLGKSQEKMQIPTRLSGQLHLYDKTENRVGRKMGHVNYVGSKKTPLLKLALKERKDFR